MQQDPFEHLEWESVNFQTFVDHVADMLAETTWLENIRYPGIDSIIDTIFINIINLNL